MGLAKKGWTGRSLRHGIGRRFSLRIHRGCEASSRHHEWLKSLTISADCWQVVATLTHFFRSDSVRAHFTRIEAHNVKRSFGNDRDQRICWSR